MTVMRLEQTMKTSMEQAKKMVPQLTANMVKQMPNAKPEDAEKASAMQAKVF